MAKTKRLSVSELAEKLSNHSFDTSKYISLSTGDSAKGSKNSSKSPSENHKAKASA